MGADDDADDNNQVSVGAATNRNDRLEMRRFVGLGLAALVALVVAGFILGGYLDATGASSIPGLMWLLHQPHPLRDVIEVVIGVPIAFGIALYLRAVTI